MDKSKIKYNSERLGLIAGTGLPMFVILGFYFYRKAESLAVFFDSISGANIISELVSLCVVPNLLLFFVFMWMNLLKSARGVIGATFIYAMIVLGLKFL
ncbi:MAG: hypothetical protein B6I20_03865 [Bacteroidetes bacterium 4572_117]|nr:MAG: hypothetical protein B6I20_03865 [Bacteroidetes bacterium 4572_117]